MELTVADAVVLALLAEGPRHGYAVHAELLRRDVADWAEISRPQIYYSLRKLAEAGLLELQTGEPSLGPERFEYRISGAGRRALEKRLSVEDWATQRPPPPFLTWLALAWAAKPAVRRQLVDRRKAFLTSQIERETATLAAIADDATVQTRIPFLMVSLSIRQFALELQWLAEVAAELAGYTELEP